MPSGTVGQPIFMVDPAFLKWSSSKCLDEPGNNDAKMLLADGTREKDTAGMMFATTHPINNDRTKVAYVRRYNDPAFCSGDVKQIGVAHTVKLALLISRSNIVSPLPKWQRDPTA